VQLRSANSSLGCTIKLRDYLGISSQLKFTFTGQEEGFYTFLLQTDIVIHNTLNMPIYYYGRRVINKDKSKHVVQEGALHPQMEYIAGQPIANITDDEDSSDRNRGYV